MNGVSVEMHHDPDRDATYIQWHKLRMFKDRKLSSSRFSMCVDLGKQATRLIYLVRTNQIQNYSLYLTEVLHDVRKLAAKDAAGFSATLAS